MPAAPTLALLALLALARPAAGLLSEPEILDEDPEARPVLLMQTVLARAPAHAKAKAAQEALLQQAVAVDAAAGIAEARAPKAARAAEGEELRSLAVGPVGEVGTTGNPALRVQDENASTPKLVPADQPLESVPVTQAEKEAKRKADEEEEAAQMKAAEEAAREALGLYGSLGQAANDSAMYTLANIQTNSSMSQESNSSKSEELASVQTNASFPQEAPGAADLPPALQLLQSLMPRELRRLDREGYLALPYATVMSFGFCAFLWMFVLMRAAAVKPDMKAEFERYNRQLDLAFKALPVPAAAAPAAPAGAES